MTTYSKELLEEALGLFQPYYNKPLSLEDAREITDNLVGLELYLRELKAKYDNHPAINPKADCAGAIIKHRKK